MNEVWAWIAFLSICSLGGLAGYLFAVLMAKERDLGE